MTYRSMRLQSVLGGVGLVLAALPLTAQNPVQLSAR